MHMGWCLKKWITDYIKLTYREYRSIVFPEIVCIEGDSPPRCYAYTKDCRELGNRIQVTDKWIKMNVPKEILAASIAERMLHAEKSYDSQLSSA